ncbi:MAG: three-Cys-motif partner protein TcmP [Terracidiphilus sp.]
MDQSFFDESREQSVIKARIISKYFWAWAKVIIPTAKQHANRIAYIDLFAGPGRYKDGTVSTPLKILEQAIADPDMSQMLVTLFNDKDEKNAGELETAIGGLPGIEKMKYKPQIANQEVGTEIVQLFNRMRMVPTFFFVDPWGYKGLSLGLINSVLENWGCDCIFFFNYNRVNMGLPNEAVREHMNVLFGEERADQVREKLNGLSPEEKETLIVEELSKALNEMGGQFVLPFTFRNDTGSRTTHHLIYVSKAFKGYEIMKGIMALESSEADQGVPSFRYSPASERFPLLFNLTTPLEDLEKELMRQFAGKTLTMKDVYEKHSVGRPFISRNYKHALSNLESAGKLQADPPADKRRMRKGERTFPDDVKVTFPKEVHSECQFVN